LNLQLRSAMKRMLSVERNYPRSLIHPERGIDERTGARECLWKHRSDAARGVGAAR
jgi:hypothetical protein